jgi:hypothetical protein
LAHSMIRVWRQLGLPLAKRLQPLDRHELTAAAAGCSAPPHRDFDPFELEATGAVLPRGEIGP